MPPAQPNRNGQSAIPPEISIPGLTLATYSRSTDPAFAPRSITHKPRVSSSSSKRKESTTPRDDVKRPKSDHVSTTSRDVSIRDSHLPAPSLHNPPTRFTPIAVDPRFVPPTTRTPFNDVNDQSNTHTPTGSRSQTPIQNSRSPSLPVGSATNQPPTPVVATTAPTYATIPNSTTSDPAIHAAERTESPPIFNVPKSDNPAEAALFAIFGRKKPSTSTSAIASPRPALLNTAGESSGEQVIGASQHDSNWHTMPTHIASTTSIHPSTSAAAPPASQRQVPTPPQTPVTAGTNSSSTMIIKSLAKSITNAPWNQIKQKASPDDIPASHPLLPSTSLYRSKIEIQTPPLTPVTAPVSAFASSTSLTTTAISATPSIELEAAADQSSPGSEPTVPPIPIDAIVTLQAVSADLFMALGKGINNENELFAAAGKMRACLQAHFVPHMDTWRADAERPKAAMVSKANDMESKAIQTITPIEPEAPKPQHISFSIPQPQTIAPILEKPHIPEYPLGVPPGRDVVEKQINVQKHLSSAKVTINNQAEKLRVQAEELKRKDNVITRLQARVKDLEGESCTLALALKAQPVEIPSRHPSISIMSKGIEVHKKEIEYLERQLEIKHAHNIRLRDLLQSNGILSGLENDIHEEGRGMEDEKRSNHGIEDEKDGMRSNHGIEDEKISDQWRGGRGQEMDGRRAEVTEEEKGGSSDEAGAEINYYRDRDREENDRTTPIGRPTTPTRRPTTPTRRPTTPTMIFSIRGHAQSPQAPTSNTRRTSGGLDKMANLMADFTELVAEKASRRLSSTRSISNEPRTTPGRSFPQDYPLGSSNSTQSDIRNSSPARSDPIDPKEVVTRRRSNTILVQGGSRAVRASDLGKDSRSPWERSRVEGKKIIPTGPRSDRPQTPPIGPVPPPIGPRLPVKTGGKKRGGIGAYYSKDKASRKMWDRYNRLE